MAKGDLVIEGRALLGEELLDRCVEITIENGLIRRILEIPPRPLPWICPALFNAHTHIGDSVAMDICLPGSLEEAVTPPHGMKHRILEKTPYQDLVNAMRASIGFMAASGTAGFADFREGGEEGVRALVAASSGLPCRPLILGREGGEPIANGAGISSVRDVKGIDALVADVRKTGGLLAFHAGERDSTDIEAALSYEPDLLVHCTHATKRQLRQIAEADIPVAICARSNWIFSVTRTSKRPPLREMIEVGCRFIVGTDNCMAVQPDLWREMSFLMTVYGIPPDLILRGAISGSVLTGESYFIREGMSARLLVIDPSLSNLWLSRDPVRTLVNRAGSPDIVKKVIS